jgi:hypothetical protein
MSELHVLESCLPSPDSGATFPADPPESPVLRLLEAEINRHTRGWPRTTRASFRKLIRSQVYLMFSNGFNNLFDSVGSTALGTGHLVVRFQILDNFSLALARAAKDYDLGLAHKINLSESEFCTEIQVSLEKSETEQRLRALELRVSQIELCLPASTEMIRRF